MINIKCQFQSVILATRVAVDVYLPNVVTFGEEIEDYKSHYTFTPFRTLYLLHGAWDGASQWVENTSVLRMAEAAGLAVVLPTVGNSFYANTLYGMNYEDFFMNELIGFVQGMFPLSDKREDNFICGISMGGYGSLKTVFKKPELFSKCAVMSAVVDISYSARIIGTLGMDIDHTLGRWKELKGSEFDLRKILEDRNGQYQELPELLLIDGTEDYLRDTNVEFHEYLNTEKIPHIYKEYPGIHDWNFWDAHLKECMDFFCSNYNK